MNTILEKQILQEDDISKDGEILIFNPYNLNNKLLK